MVNNNSKTPDQTRHEEAMQALYQLPKRGAVGYLLSPHYINDYYRIQNIPLTPARLAEIKALLHAVANDPEHNPQTQRERIFAEIRHDLGYLSHTDAIHFNAHPQCFIAYLIQKYQRTAGHDLMTITLPELNNLNSVLNAVIECGP